MQRRMASSAVAGLMMGAGLSLVGLTGAYAVTYGAWEVNYGSTDGPGLGECSDNNEIQTDYGKGCFRPTGDYFIARDTAYDGRDVGVKWWNDATERRGVCRGNGGRDKYPPYDDRSCNKRFLKNTFVVYQLVRAKTPPTDENDAANWVDGTSKLKRLNPS